ncbi:MBL fold metallo-hydrolase [Desertivirga arenae]|uniref:MBL fold metallo-hydrolase n=1 Tax=Desertivirga arenae TaxID=2810309 RepID=UPI001A9596CD|nr:MBL fold metallo-hydrolase [Pedobacter sp. SYSU D00823]
MALEMCSLNSGSNGNCYYIAGEDDAVLIDAGLSCRETEKRMKRLGLHMDKVKAIFISHEHTDHIKGVASIAKKYKLPIYITPNTYRNSGLQLDQELILSFKANIPVIVGSLSITAFPKFHDAADPHSFIVGNNNNRVGVFTDIGIVCENVIEHFQQCHAVFLEANYDDAMLDRGRYPYFLKNRIRGGQGHLSNAQALKLFRDYKSNQLKYLFLSHLSKDNNCPDLAYTTFNIEAGKTEIVVASRHEESRIYYLESPKVIPEDKFIQLQLDF